MDEGVAAGFVPEVLLPVTVNGWDGTICGTAGEQAAMHNVLITITR